MKGNKRGQELTLGTIILIVLGVVVLIFLIYGFSTGWSNLWQRITGLGGGKVNVDTVRTACLIACGNEEVYSFCNEGKKVVLDGGYENPSVTCNQLVGKVNFAKGSESKNETGIVSECARISCLGTSPKRVS